MSSAITKDPRPVSVVIPTWNGGPRYLKLLDVLADQDIAGGFQLVVVDSGSKDGTREASEAAGGLIVHQDQKTFNHGGARNKGIAASSGQVIVLLTQDAVPMGRDFVTNMLKPYADASVDGVYARQFPQDDCDPILKERLRGWTACRTEPVQQFFVQADADASLAEFNNLPPMERYLRCAFDNVASSVRRSTWEAKPFPERNFGEDMAWARRVLLDGGTVHFEPSAEVEHSHPISMKREFFRLYRDHKNLYELFGLHNVPTWKRVREGWKWQIGYYKELIAGLDISEREKRYWRWYILPYAGLETTAQFLGARSHWKAQESKFWAKFDVWACAD
ncbi:MAG: glycosyltransferase [Planctomycetota bacterium]|nr:glycosyltransferase [Planctomycetota bacterium]MDG2142616.1 glycosyltransferase [Planctomycetota bacterium]